MKKNTGFSDFLPAVRIVGLGCAKNFVDTEIAAAALLTAGFGIAGEDDEADIMFINTCAFLLSARKEAEQAIAAAKRWKKKRACRKIIVAGCIVSWDQDGSFQAAHPEVDEWCSIHAVEEIGEVAARVWNGSLAGTVYGKDHAPYIYNHETPRVQLTPPHYAYLKIADGCDNRCSYCKIPDIRGTLRSRTVEDVLGEAKNLLANGVKELIVIAQDTSAFGRDLCKKPQLAELLKRMDALDGNFLIRVMYLHPASVTDELLKVMANCKHLIKCLEIPLQHIADPILKAMHRRIGTDATKALVKKLRFDLGFALRTTFMVGFPGETEDDFQQLLDFVKEIGFTRLGAFVYSREAGVPAAEMKDQVPARIGAKRLKQLMELQAEISRKANEDLIGKTVDVIIDDILPRGKAVGRMFADAPEIDNTVFVKGVRKQVHKPGDFIKVMVEAASEYEIQGTIRD